MEQTHTAKSTRRRRAAWRITNATSSSEPGPSSSSAPAAPEAISSPLSLTTEFGQYYGARNAPRLFVTNPDQDTMDEATPAANTPPHQRETRTLAGANNTWHPTTTTPRINASGSSLVEPECGICGDKVLLLNESPLSALEVSSPSRPLGIALPCYGMVIGHTYCFTCISGYLKTNLAEASFRTVFAIRCPECDYIIMDQQAERILDRQDLEGLWYWAKLFEEVQTVSLVHSIVRTATAALGLSYHLENAPAPSEKRIVPSVGRHFVSAASPYGMRARLALSLRMHPERPHLTKPSKNWPGGPIGAGARNAASSWSEAKAAVILSVDAAMNSVTRAGENGET
ncbi:hypothetical protein FRC00_006912, partial [Tulasnella sp. 408]